MPQAIYDYHYGIEAEQYAYFRIPKLLMTEPHFKDISTDAKLLYGLMLDRMGLSVKNGWLEISKALGGYSMAKEKTGNECKSFPVFRNTLFVTITCDCRNASSSQMPPHRTRPAMQSG